MLASFTHYNTMPEERVGLKALEAPVRDQVSLDFGPGPEGPIMAGVYGRANCLYMESKGLPLPCSKDLPLGLPPKGTIPHVLVTQPSPHGPSGTFNSTLGMLTLPGSTVVPWPHVGTLFSRIWNYKSLPALFLSLWLVLKILLRYIFSD